MTSLMKSVGKRLTGAAPPPTAVEPEKAIPGDTEEREAKRESIRRQSKRRGRKSTILTSLSDEKLGG